MTELEIESDEFLTLLTDALRAGPGSPQWHEALGRLRSSGIEHADEYHLLVTAREHLESGKGYRAVRAGPGFTQRLMSSIEQQAAPAQRAPWTPAAIAVVSAGMMLAVLLVIGYLLFTGADRSSHPQSGTLLVNTIAAADFSGSPQSDWHKIGRLPISIARGNMKHAPTTAPGEQSDATGGGITWSQGIAPDEVFAVVANLRVQRQEENLIAQLFVSDQPDFDDDNSTSPHELLWLLQLRQAQVILPSGRLEAQMDLGQNFKGGLTVSITIDRDQASVDQGGNRLWSGAHGLDPNKPRYIGVRFLKRSKDAGDGVAFQALRVNTRQK